MIMPQPRRDDAMMARLRRYLGRTVEVLVEQRNPKNIAQVKGRNRQGCPVFFDGDADALVGKLVLVKVTEALTYSLVGEQAGEPY